MQSMVIYPVDSIMSEPFEQPDPETFLGGDRWLKHKGFKMGIFLVKQGFEIKLSL